MKLPGLPTSRDNIRARAEKEGWPTKEQVAQGGPRRVYEIPARYLPQAPQESAANDGATVEERFAAVREKQKAIGMDDANLLEAIIEGVERFGQDVGTALTPERKAMLITLFYRYFREEGAVDKDKLSDMLRKVG